MKIIRIIFLIAMLSSCTQKEKSRPKNNPYFDIKHYFENEATRLNKKNLQIQKTVSINDITESKWVKINDFKSELNSFIIADINKASWSGEFIVKKENSSLLYTTENENIPIKKIQISYQNSKVKSIQIIQVTNNILYHSIDTLSYFTDSLYQIKKIQKIKLLKEKKYKVMGRLR